MNCRPGDLAICIASDNLGGLVRVLRRATFEEKWVNEDWLCESLSAMKCCATGVVTPPGEEGVMYDEDLRPIRGDGITTEEVSELFSPSPAKESEKV